MCLPCWNDSNVMKIYSCPVRHLLCEFHVRKHACDEGIFAEAISAVTNGLSIIPDTISMESLNNMDGNARNAILTGYAYTVIVQPYEIYRRLADRYQEYSGNAAFASITNELNKQPATTVQIRFAFTHSQIYFVPYTLDIILKNTYDGQLHFYSKTTLPVLMESLNSYATELRDHLLISAKRFPEVNMLPTAPQSVNAARAPVNHPNYDPRHEMSQYPGHAPGRLGPDMNNMQVQEHLTNNHLPYNSPPHDQYVDTHSIQNPFPNGNYPNPHYDSGRDNYFDWNRH